MNLWKNLQFTHKLCHRISQHYKRYIYPLKREKKGTRKGMQERWA